MIPSLCACLSINIPVLSSNVWTNLQILMKHDDERYATSVLTSILWFLASIMPKCLPCWLVRWEWLRTTLIQGSEILCCNRSLQDVQLLLKIFNNHLAAACNLYLCFLVTVLELYIGNFVQRRTMNVYWEVYATVKLRFYLTSVNRAHEQIVVGK